MQTTGNAGGTHNLIVEPGSLGQEELLRQLDTGLWVTELLGHGVNLVTGDYSRGASGFWVEQGQVRYPVHEITIAGNLNDLFRGVVAVGADVDMRGGIRCGSLLLERMTVAGEWPILMVGHEKHVFDPCAHGGDLGVMQLHSAFHERLSHPAQQPWAIPGHQFHHGSPVDFIFPE
jgi:hypothetical protein